MPTLEANGLQMYYEVRGDPAAPPLLLIHGLGAQCIYYPDAFCDQLVDAGFRVIRFDNRDAGHSTWFSDQPAVIDPSGLPQPVYSLGDMADDTAALLAAMGVESAHVLGQSLGGMVAQRLTIDHPGVVRSLCSISSTTGNPGVGQPSDEALVAMFRPPAEGREAAIQASIEASLVWASPAYPMTPEDRWARAAAAYDRGENPDGNIRLAAAVVHAVDRTEDLARVAVPTLVIHGKTDALVDVSGGEATAAAVPDARLVLFDGMGHDLPESLWPEFVRIIADNARRAPNWDG